MLGIRLRVSHNNFLQELLMKAYCLSDISPSRTHNRRDRSPGYRLCYVTEQYVPRIGHLKERVRTDALSPAYRQIISDTLLLSYNPLMSDTVLLSYNQLTSDTLLLS
jgi:hypothetical protein